MIFDNIRNYVNGWFIGAFEPTLVKTKAFEIAHHLYKKGFKAPPHIHKVATEYNYVVRGDLAVGAKRLGPGDIFIYQPNEVADVVFLADTDIIIIKMPSVPGDKYSV